MQIIDQSHKILRFDNIEVIERAGRTCYKSEDKIGCTVEGQVVCVSSGRPGVCRRWKEDEQCARVDCEYHSSNEFCRKLIRLGHEAMIEHAVASVRFITNRGVTHEIVRHRIASYGQESTRYVNYHDKGIQFIRPVWIPQKDIDRVQNDTSLENVQPEDVEQTLGWAMLFVDDCEYHEKRYNHALKLGQRPEQARGVLPNDLKTEIVVTANFREWRHFFKLRCDTPAHPQMRALMRPVLQEFYNRCPACFEDAHDWIMSK